MFVTLVTNNEVERLSVNNNIDVECWDQIPFWLSLLSLKEVANAKCQVLYNWHKLSRQWTSQCSSIRIQLISAIDWSLLLRTEKYHKFLSNYDVNTNEPIEWLNGKLFQLNFCDLTRSIEDIVLNSWKRGKTKFQIPNIPKCCQSSKINQRNLR